MRHSLFFGILKKNDPMKDERIIRKLEQYGIHLKNWRERGLNIIAVGLGGFIGAVLRYLIGRIVWNE